MNTRIRSAALISAVIFTALPSIALASFDQNLSVGAHGSAVVSLQQFLISQKLLADDSATGFFGPLTLSAVKAFQLQQNISPASGFFGPLTRARANTLAGATIGAPPSTNVDLSAQIAALLAQVQQLQAQIQTQPGTSPVTPSNYSASAMPNPAPAPSIIISTPTTAPRNCSFAISWQVTNPTAGGFVSLILVRGTWGKMIATGSTLAATSGSYAWTPPAQGILGSSEQLSGADIIEGATYQIKATLYGPQPGPTSPSPVLSSSTSGTFSFGQATSSSCPINSSL